MSNERILVLGIGNSGREVIENLLAHKVEGIELLTVKEDSEFVKSFVIPKLEGADLIFIIGEVFNEFNRKIVLDAAKFAREQGILRLGIFKNADENFTQKFLKHAHGVFEDYSPCEIITGISDLITKSGFVNLDFNDIKAVLVDSGRVYFAFGEAEGENRSELATEKILKALPKDKKLVKVLMNITTGNEVSLTELVKPEEVIVETCSEDAYVVWGHVVEEDFGDKFRVEVFAC